MTTNCAPPTNELLGTLLVPGPQFIHSELSAMTLDGVLCHVLGEVYRPSGIPDTPSLRAAAAHHLVPAQLHHRAVLGQLTAAWVYGCAPPPDVVALLVHNDGNSVSLPRRSGCSVRQVQLADGEVCVLGSSTLTSALRTALDVARSAPPALARKVLIAMAETPALECRLDLIHRALLQAPHVPGKLRGTQLLRDLLEPGRNALQG